MEKQYRVDLFVEDGVTRVRSYLSNFTGNIFEWKESFYEIWRYQMTYSFAYEITVHEVHDGDVCIDMLIKDSFLENVKELLEHLGYTKTDIWSEHIGTVSAWEIDDDELFFITAE